MNTAVDKNSVRFIQRWLNVQKEDYKRYFHVITVLLDDLYKEGIKAPTNILSFDGYLQLACKKEDVNYVNVKEYLVSENQNKNVLETQSNQR